MRRQNKAIINPSHDSEVVKAFWLVMKTSRVMADWLGKLIFSHADVSRLENGCCNAAKAASNTVANGMFEMHGTVCSGVSSN